MSVTVTPLADGGRVESSWNGGGAVHLQKYDAHGVPVGPEYVDTYNSNQQPQVVALSNGGYAVMVGFVFKGAEYPVHVFNAAGAEVYSFETAGSGIGATLVSSPVGGFMVITQDRHADTTTGQDYSWRPFLALYDNSGAAVRGPAPLSGDQPTVTVGADGHYQVHWVDGNLTHDLNIDPANPPALAAPAAPSVTMIDNQGASTGVIAPGAYTTDSTPVVRVAVHEIGSVEVSRQFQSGAESTIEGGVAVTAADVARGYVDVELGWSAYGGSPPASLSGTSWTFYAHVRNAEGVISEATAVSQPMVFQPEIWRVTDDVGPTAGPLSDGAITDDPTPTLRIGLESSGLTAGSRIIVRDNGVDVAHPTVTSADVANGYVDVTTAALPNGDHALTVVDTGPYRPAFHLTVAAGDHDTQPQLLDGGKTAGGTSVSVWEGNLPWGSYPDAAQTTVSKSFYAYAPDGVKDLVVDGHAVITGGVFSPVSFGFSGIGTVSFTGYDAATGKVSYSFKLESPMVHQPGTGQVGLSGPMTLTDTDGDQAGSSFTVTVADDAPRAYDDAASTTVGGPTVTGNLLSNDRGADHPYLATVNGRAVSGSASFIGAKGELMVSGNGAFSYTPFTSGQGGADRFTYTIRDPGDGGASQAVLTVGVADAPASTAGQVVTSHQYGDTLAGGAGADTLQAGQGPDQLTGGGGGDLFSFRNLPWNAGHVTDFAVGSDRLDLSALFQASGYTGSDPIRDGYVTVQNDGAGGAVVYYDTDGAGSGNTIQFKITTLDHVSGTATWAQLSGGGTTPPPPGPAKEVNISPASVSHTEGQSGTTAYSFTITRSGDVSQGATTSYRVVGSGANPADASDFQNGAMPAVIFAWNPGEASRVITVNVAGDSVSETDETFSVVLSTPGAGNSNPTPVGANGTATGIIVNDDAASPAGQVYTSPGPGSTVTGGAGNDTLNASQGADVLTGNGGGDVFAYGHLPWSAGRITDFHIGEDGLDLSTMLRDASYTGSDPVADGYVRLVNDVGGASTLVYLDADGAGSAHQWDGFFTTLQGVYGAGGTAGGVSTLTWAQLTGGGSSQPPPPPQPAPDGQVITSQREGDTLNGTAGNDTLNAGQGQDRLTGGAGADHFAFARLPWNAGHITDFAPGVDKLDLSGLFTGYTGHDPLADHTLEFRADEHGGTQVYVDHDGPNNGDWPFLITTLDGVAPTQIGAGDWIIG